jgi:hypothetical protein
MFLIARIHIAKFQECDNPLRNTVDIYGITAIVIVLNFPILKKEVVFIEVQPLSYTWRELVCAKVTRDGS